MPDLLTHVLLAYVWCTLLARRGWLRDRHVSVGMIGAAIPDVAKFHLVFDLDPLSMVVGVPLNWQALHTLGGSLVLATMGALLFDARERRPVFALFAAGACVHLFLDSFVIRADGIAPPYLYPFTWWQPPAGNLYLSSDPILSGFAIGLVSFTWLVGRVQTRRSVSRGTADRR